MGLEIPTNKTPGDEVRRTAAPRPALVGLMIIALTLIQWVLLVLVFWAVAKGWNSPSHVTPQVASAPLGGILKSDQQIIAAWLGGIFYCLAFIIFLYQRYFMDHVTIAKRRFRKWEDEGVQLR
jgi:Na+/proline symporter